MDEALSIVRHEQERGEGRESEANEPLGSSCIGRDNHGVLDLATESFPKVLKHCWLGVQLWRCESALCEGERDN